MQWISTLLTVLFILIAVVMTFFILLQEGKGGGLAGLGGTKAAGVEGVTNPIRRATAWLAGIFFLLAIILGVMNRPKETHYEPEVPTAEATASELASKPKAADQTPTTTPEAAAFTLPTRTSADGTTKETPAVP